MSTARLLIGDVFERMAEIPDGSIDLVLTSPPFLALRSYLPDDHPDKAKEIGSEATPAEFLDTLLRLTARWRELLAPHGSIAVELGDTYSGSGGAGGDYADGGMREGQPRFRGRGAAPKAAGHPRRRDERHHRGGDDEAVRRRAAGKRDGMEPYPGWPAAKSLTGIPHLYHLSLAYGRNLLTGEESTAGRWRVRNVVAWCRPNPPVGALGDKFRPATSYLTIATVARDRYFDLDAVRSPHKDPDDAMKERRAVKGSSRADGLGRPTDGRVSNEAGAPPLDWWEIPTQPYGGSHYATWPTALLTKPIRAMVPQRVCTACGQPSTRLTETETTSRIGGNNVKGADETSHRFSERTTTTTTTTGWTDCGHDSWRTGVVLDPFAGSGTTLAVATGEGREAIGIDIDERNVALVEERVGRMFLEVELPEAVA